MPALRLAAVSSCALALAAPAISPAHAVAPQVAAATAGNTYVVTEIYVVQGGRLFFANTDPQQPHDLRSADDRNLFNSGDLITAGQVAEVVGVSSLAVSSWPFVCSAHSTMRGNLHIVAAG